MAANRKRKTHCKRGHPLAGENLYVRKDGARRCRECKNAKQREYDRVRGSWREPSPEEFRGWWLERFSPEEIREMALAFEEAA